MAIKDRFIHAAKTLSELGRMWPWALVSVVALLVVVQLNPAKGGAYLWIVSKLSTAAVIGFGVDVAAFTRRPGELDGIEQAMAQTRQATLIGAAMIAAGLMP